MNITNLQIAWAAFWAGVAVGIMPIVYINVMRLLAA